MLLPETAGVSLEELNRDDRSPRPSPELPG